MEGVFLGGSLAAAFLAGSIALFAPCCITVLFPTYLAAAVKNARWRLVPLTLVFAAGVATVLVPVTLGVSLLTRSLMRYHSTVYLVGAGLMLVMALVVAAGKTWSLPLLAPVPGHLPHRLRRGLRARGLLRRRVRVLRPGTGRRADLDRRRAVDGDQPRDRPRLRRRHGVPTAAAHAAVGPHAAP